MRQLSNHYVQAKRLTLLCGSVNIVLALLKLSVGRLANSHALFADGVHSLSDVFIDVFVWLATRYGNKKADADHPYGHARIETVAVVAVAMLICLAGLGIFVDAGLHLLSHHTVVQRPDSVTLWVAGGSLLMNEGIFRYILAMATRLDSSLLKSYAWHSRGDAVSSLLVLLGISVSLLGYPHCDLIAALGVGLWIFKVGFWDLGWVGIRELVDTGLGPQELTDIQQAILKVAGVRSIHQLRTRCMAGYIILDVHVLVDAYISVSEGHYIGTQVHHQLVAQFAKVIDVTVHVDPENDENESPTLNLPARNLVITDLQRCFHALPGFADSRVLLHYLDGTLEVELHLPLACAGEHAEETVQAYHQAATKATLIFKLSLLFMA